MNGYIYRKEERIYDFRKNEALCGEQFCYPRHV